MNDHITIRLDSDYRRHIATAFSRLRHEKKFWDCKIIVGTETLYCHSCIVSSLSPKIEEMIESKIRDGSEKEITLDNIQPKVMRKITNYMYTGCVEIPNDLVFEVVQVCDELKIEDLKERCLYRVPKILSKQTAIEWLRYARKHSLDSICESCEQYISYSFSDIGKKFLIRCSLDELKTTLQDLNGVVPPENLLAFVFSWINYDKTSRKKALDYTSGYLDLKECRTQFLMDSVKVHLDIVQSNPEFNRRVTHILQPRKLTVVVIGGAFKKDENIYYNRKCWKLGSNTQFGDITEIPDDFLRRGASICYYDLTRLILTGGEHTELCVMLDVSRKKWTKMKNLKRQTRRHGSVCICQELFIFGGDNRVKWSNSVEFLNIEQEHGEWQSALPMPRVLKFPKITNLDTSVYVMGDNDPYLYPFDVKEKAWSFQTVMPQNPGIGFCIAAARSNLYVTGGTKKICWQYNFSADSWAKLSSPSLRRRYGALIANQNSLLLLGGNTENIEGYAVEGDIWAIAPYNLPEKISFPYAFMMDLGQ